MSAGMARTGEAEENASGVVTGGGSARETHGSVRSGPEVIASNLAGGRRRTSSRGEQAGSDPGASGGLDHSREAAGQDVLGPKAK